LYSTSSPPPLPPDFGTPGSSTVEFFSPERALFFAVVSSPSQFFSGSFLLRFVGNAPAGRRSGFFCPSRPFFPHLLPSSFFSESIQERFVRVPPAPHPGFWRPWPSSIFFCISTPKLLGVYSFLVRLTLSLFYAVCANTVAPF